MQDEFIALHCLFLLSILQSVTVYVHCMPLKWIYRVYHLVFKKKMLSKGINDL